MSTTLFFISQEEKMSEDKTIARAGLLYLSKKHKGDWDLIYKSIASKEDCYEEAIAQYKNSNQDFIVAIDENYPKRMLNSYKPPFVVFYKGNLSLLDDPNKNITVFNSHNASEYANNAIKELCRTISSKMNIVLPLGGKNMQVLCMDLLDRGANVVLTLPKGLDYQYSNDERKIIDLVSKNGLVISEMPDDIEPSERMKLITQRIASFISSYAIVGAVSKKEKMMIPVGFSISSATEVFCLPFPMGSKYISNTLINQGATLIESEKTIIEGVEMSNGKTIQG